MGWELERAGGGRVKAGFTRLSTSEDRHTHTVQRQKGLYTQVLAMEETEIPVSCRLKTTAMLQLRQPRKVQTVLRP